MIGVLGASGRVGRHVAGGLAAAGVPARALVRDPDRVDLPIAPCTRTFAVPARCRPRCDGVERLLLLTPHVPDQDLLEAAAVDAAAAAGVRRIVKVSGGPATLGPNGTTPTATAHWRSEQRIERAALEFAFLRPSFFMQNLLDDGGPAVAAAAPRRAVRRRADRHGRRARRGRLRGRRPARRPALPAARGT